jgi:hypothetical protein
MDLRSSAARRCATSRWRCSSTASRSGGRTSHTRRHRTNPARRPVVVRGRPSSPGRRGTARGHPPAADSALGQSAPWPSPIPAAKFTPAFVGAASPSTRLRSVTAAAG